MTIDFNTARVLHPKSYWHFNVKLLNDKFFVKILNVFGKNGN